MCDMAPGDIAGSIFAITLLIMFAIPLSAMVGMMVKDCWRAFRDF